MIKFLVKFCIKMFAYSGRFPKKALKEGLLMIKLNQAVSSMLLVLTMLLPVFHC